MLTGCLERQGSSTHLAIARLRAVVIGASRALQEQLRLILIAVAAVVVAAVVVVVAPAVVVAAVVVAAVVVVVAAVVVVVVVVVVLVVSNRCTGTGRQLHLLLLRLLRWWCGGFSLSSSRQGQNQGQG